VLTIKSVGATNMKIIMTSFILFLSICSFGQESSDKTETPAEKVWAAGLSLSLASSYGINIYRKLENSWFVQTTLETRSFGCCLGDNPNTQVPFGYEIENPHRDQLSILVNKKYIVNSDLYLYAGVGLGVARTSASAQFYNPAWIGYDKSSPAGTDTYGDTRIIMPGKFGVGQDRGSYFANAAIEISLIKEPDPYFRSPNGKEVTPDSHSFNSGKLTAEIGILF
jgi:hypothetical protein